MNNTLPNKKRISSDPLEASIVKPAIAPAAPSSPKRSAALDSNFNKVTASSNIPRDVRMAMLTGKDPARLADWMGSTQGQQMGGLGGAKDDLLLSPYEKQSRELQLEGTIAGNRRAAESHTLNMENSRTSAERAEESHDLNMQVNRFRLDDAMSAGEKQQVALEDSIVQNQQLGNAKADILEAQNPGLGTVLARTGDNIALESSIVANRQGKLEAADDLLGMRISTNKPDPLQVQNLEGYGNVLTQSGKYLGTAPKSAEEAVAGALETIEQDGVQYYRTGTGAYRPVPGQSLEPMNSFDISLYQRALKASGFTDEEIKSEIARKTNMNRPNGQQPGSSATTPTDPKAAKQDALSRLGL